ncbi:MAG: tRNA (N6-isopentenyl adenosine(37)-C2)-methylthiotransferase MiaB [Desulfobacteraceae bacterium 4572_130]|nr:MAG: tRNA (N6-isopentenyl adenosine(37)-C2)-methylthiotransferase MiaB [Desulfobacteraceae bacterium 4572_130]
MSRFKGYVYIYTIGCQMNVYDSEKFFSILHLIGYEKTEILDNADIIICNTCSIREKAQEKAFSFLGTIADKKKKNPKLISIMAGCVAQQEGANVFKRIPKLDIVVGTCALKRIGKHIKAIQLGKRRITDIKEEKEIFETMPDNLNINNKKVSKFVTIMQGCNNFCTYCIVPFVRGREKSRNPENILKEIRNLGSNGVKEVTLLGQNVNSYGKKEGITSFSELLGKISEIDSIKRIRFATSHPRDLSDDLIFAIKNIDKVCNHLHLPVQSGSDKILKKMNRGYTKEIYLEKIEKLRTQCPEIALSSDIIVGFPFEIKHDFNETVELIKQVEFDSIFAFAYSGRPGTKALKFSNQINEQEKKERLNELLKIQDLFTKKKNQALVGKIQSVLVEGKSLRKRNTPEPEKQILPQMTGRTESGKIVHFYGENIKAGDILNIKIKNAYPHSLWGGIC